MAYRRPRNVGPISQQPTRAMIKAEQKKTSKEVKKDVAVLKSKVRKLNAAVDRKWWIAGVYNDPAAQITLGSSFSLVTNIANGGTVNDREGNDAVLTSISWTSYVLGNIIPANGWCRHVMIIDRQPVQGVGGAVVPPTWGEVFQNPGGAFTQIPIIWPQNENTKKRFKIICDKRFLVNPTGFSSMGTAAIAQTVKRYNIRFRGGMKLKWTGNAGNTCIGPHVFSIFGTDVGGNFPNIAFTAIGRFIN